MALPLLLINPRHRYTFFPPLFIMARIPSNSWWSPFKSQIHRENFFKTPMYHPQIPHALYKTISIDNRREHSWFTFVSGRLRTSRKKSVRYLRGRKESNRPLTLSWGSAGPERVPFRPTLFFSRPDVSV